MACPYKNTLNILKFAIIMQLYSALYVVRLCSREDQISNSRHSTDRHIMAYSHSNGSFFENEFMFQHYLSVLPTQIQFERRMIRLQS